MRNPMDEELTLRQKVSVICWGIFSITSTYCAAQSLHNSTTQEKWICYVVGGAIVATASLGLYQIKRASDEGFVKRRSLRLIVGSFIFLLSWLFILAANTHFIYFKMAVDRTRLNELNTVNTNFDLIKNKAFTEIDTMTSSYSKQIDNEIENLKTEITNPYNPGHAQKTDSILKRIEILIGDNADLMSNPPPPNDKNALRVYADRNAEKIRRIRQNNIEPILDAKKKIESYFVNAENMNTIKALNYSIKNFYNIDENSKKSALRNSYTLFDKVYKAISDLSISLGKRRLTIDVSRYQLSEIPPSIDMEDIATAWKMFFKDFHNARFVWSIILAMVIDVACFAFWYFGVLSED